MSDQEYKMPKLNAMDRVLISQSPDWSNPIPGWISRAKNQGADVVSIVSGRGMIFRDAMYYDDPRVKGNPHLFEDGDRGVFRLAQSELDQRAILDELAIQRTLIDQLAAQIAAMPPAKSSSKNTEK